MDFIKEEEKDMKNIFRRLRKRDFSGNTGIVVKNSTYQFMTGITAKIGAFIFVIILARLLMPELFGLYNLALATIFLFANFADLGLGTTIVRFVSKYLGENKKEKAKAYLIYLGKIKFILIILFMILLLIASKFIADAYNKPMFLALIAGSLFIFFMNLTNLLQSTLQSLNNFKSIFYGEIIFQISRIVLVSLAVIITLKHYTEGGTLFFLFLALAASYLLTGLFLWTTSVRKQTLIKIKKSKLSLKESKRAKKFFLLLSTTALSGFFFGYIDKLMLGAFVSAEFIGFYSAGFNLVAALSALAGFGVVVLPIFSRLKEKELEKGFKKTVRIVLSLGILLAIITFLLAPFLIKIFYGSEYSSATNILRILSLLLIATPLIGIYQSFFVSIGKPQTVTKLLIPTTIINIFLNYVLITTFLKFGELSAITGAGIATLISQFLLFFSFLIVKRKSSF